MTSQSYFEILTVTSSNQLEELFTSSPNNISLAIVLCVEGGFDILMHGIPHHVSAGNLMFVHRDTYTSPSNISTSGLHLKIALASIEFLNSLNFDINVINSITFTPNRLPIIPLSPASYNLVDRYFELMSLNLTQNTQPVYVNSISRNLFAALIYQMLQVGAENQSIDSPSLSSSGRISRRHAYVRSFLQLLHANYASHRTVLFYADKLCLSPKYLGNVVREVTGHSAAEWIDHIVILEAKNLLRYSGLNIQQVAYRLNFSSQGSFGKYFKHFTGLSPTEFQKS